MTGATLGQFEIVEEIGRGGMGVVYRARQLSLDRDVALKVLLSHQALDPTAMERFKREASLVAGLAHPNIIQILDAGEDTGRHFIAMEFVEGRTVSQILKGSGPSGFRDAVHICSQIASALGAIHEKGLIHRDVKPSNILVGRQQFAKLADFGVATLASPEEGDRLTMTRAAVGTPYYMSPEQVKAREVLTGASDVYSLGVVLFEMLAGRHPFGDATPTEAMMQQCSEPFPPIRRYRGDIPDDLEKLLQRCLAKNKAERFADGAALHEALEQVRRRIEFGESESGESSEEYRQRVTGTGFFYADAAGQGEARAVVGLRALWWELMAQVRDPHKKQRRDLHSIYLHSVLARNEYKRSEKQFEDLRKRQKYHQDKAAQHRSRTQELIAAGESEEAAASSEKESASEKLALDYGHQVEELGKQVQKLRETYDRLRGQHAQAADELALRDADARRAGKPIPTGHDDAGLANRARLVRRCGATLVLAVALAALGVILLHITSPPLPSIPTEGLVSYWSFDGDALDDWGSNDGTVTGATLTTGVGGVADTAYNFAEESNIILVNGPSGLSGNANLTWSGWIRINGNSSSGYGYLGLQGAIGDYEWLIYYDTISYPGIRFGRGRTTTGDWRLAAGNYPLNEFFHLTIIYDGSSTSNDPIFYVNGQPQSITERVTPSGTLRTSTSNQLDIGNRRSDSTRGFKGSIDEVRIYSRALTAEEVTALYEADAPDETAPTVTVIGVTSQHTTLR